MHQQTMQLACEQCKHCGQTHQLVSHGFIRKKRAAGDPYPVGKRVFCSNRHHRTGCGHTMQLYLDSTLRYMHHVGSALVAFVLLLLAGVSITLAYTQATHAQTPRHAYRWLHRIEAQMSNHRSLLHQPLLAQPPPFGIRPHGLRRTLLAWTFAALLSRFKQPLCQTYQLQLQRPFV
jgi:transposase-like protein